MNGKPDSFDVVVVGGGPAGSSAAFALAARGCTVCLVDKSAFPREKLCGGGVTERSRAIFERVFERQWNEALFLPSSDIAFHARGRLLAAPPARSHRTTMYFTMRFDFDAYLVGLAEARGVVVKADRRVVAIDPERKTIALEGGETIAFSYLVGADGVNSQVAKHLFGSSFDADTIGFGLEVEVPRDHMPAQAGTVSIDFTAVRWGYGWVFPKQHAYTVGVGGVHRLNPDMKERLRSFLVQLGLDAARYPVKGQYIPFGAFRKKPGRGSILLCGDAAGTVDPITGEGIAYAMETGLAAAQAVVEARQRGSEDALGAYLPHYMQAVTCIRQANRWKYVIFPAPVMRLFSRAFADASSLQVWYLQMLAGRHGYDALPAAFLRQAGAGFRKLAGWLFKRRQRMEKP